MNWSMPPPPPPTPQSDVSGELKEVGNSGSCQPTLQDLLHCELKSDSVYNLAHPPQAWFHPSLIHPRLGTKLVPSQPHLHTWEQGWFHPSLISRPGNKASSIPVSSPGLGTRLVPSQPHLQAWEQGWFHPSLISMPGNKAGSIPASSPCLGTRLVPSQPHLQAWEQG